ncbi:hypothetical protein GOBAR_DD12951 [Gossypium barbadense]|nr:hypothetical protein GOBAR_DD12951 [Gossypium barbadense]
MINKKPHLGKNVLSNFEWKVWWMQKAGLVYEDYARKNGLKLPQFIIAKYEVKAELSNTKKEEESEDKKDPKEDSEEDLEEIQKANRTKLMGSRSLILINFEHFLF